jgi:hypothetical protein
MTHATISWMVQLDLGVDTLVIPALNFDPLRYCTAHCYNHISLIELLRSLGKMFWTISGAFSMEPSVTAFDGVLVYMLHLGMKDLNFVFVVIVHGVQCWVTEVFELLVTRERRKLRVFRPSPITPIVWIMYSWLDFNTSNYPILARICWRYIRGFG